MKHLLRIFGKEFSRLIVLAFILAAPAGWFLMSQWLENYAYHVEINGWIFLIEFSIIAGIVLFTVGYKAMRSGLMNPVRALRTE